MSSDADAKFSEQRALAAFAAAERLTLGELFDRVEVRLYTGEAAYELVIEGERMLDSGRWRRRPEVRVGREPVDELVGVDRLRTLVNDYKRIPYPEQGRPELTIRLLGSTLSLRVLGRPFDRAVAHGYELEPGDDARGSSSE